MSGTKRPGRLDWIETIEVERVDEDSELEQQSRSTQGAGGSTAPILRKQQTSSSNDHTSDGESSTEDLAGVAIMERNRRIRNNPTNPTTTSELENESNAEITTAAEDVLDRQQQQERRRHRMKLAAICFLASLLLIAIVVGGVCGSGKCPQGRRSSAAAAEIELYPERYNDVCQRAVGPLTIGKIPAIGSLSDVATLSTVPVCTSSQIPTSMTTYGRWFKLTGGDEVIRASTCNRGPEYTTTVDTKLSIFQGSDCNNLECVATNDDFCGTSSSVSLLASKGVNYYIFVSDEGNTRNITNSSSTNAASASSSFDFVLSVDHEDNGLCASAIGPLVPTNGDDDIVVIPGSLRASDNIPYALSCDSNTAQNGNVWYTVFGTGSWVKASTCHNITNFEARIDVTSGECDNRKCVSIRDSDCGGNGYQAVWKSEKDVVYNLAVFRDDITSGSVFGLSLQRFTPVDNDQCQSPADIDSDGSIVLGSTLDATFDLEAPSCPTNSVSRPQPGVWYRVGGTGKTMMATTCNNATNFATEITVYSASSSCYSLSCVASARKQFCKDDKAAVYWESVKGEEYLLYLQGADYDSVPNVGQFGLSVSDFITEKNDLCVNAISMDIANNSKVEGSTLLATSDYSCDLSSSETAGVWYSIQGTGGFLRASTCDQATTFDTQISVFVGDCTSNLTCVIFDDNSCGLQSSVAWSTEVNTTYYVLVHGSDASSVGDFVLTIQEYSPTQSNDFCPDSIALEPNGTVAVGSTVEATYDNIGTCESVPNTDPGVWYQVQGTGRRLTASLCHDETATSARISVLVSDCTDQTCVAANDNSAISRCSEISWLSTLDQTYHLLVHGVNGQQGQFGLSIVEDQSTSENDYCVDATQISLSSDILIGSTVNSTDDEVAPCMDVVQTGYGVWYSVVGTGDRIIASTCMKTDANFDTKISVFTGPNCGNITCVVADDNGCGIQSRAVWRGQLDVTYYILVHSPLPGQFGLMVDTFVPALQNDFCTSAQGPIIPNGQVAIGSTFDSSFDNMGYCGADDTSPGVWFFVLGTGERLTADTCDNRTNFDTKLSIFTGINCSNLTCVTGNDDGCGLQSSITWQTEIGKFYYILLHGWGTNSFGNYALTVSGSEFPY